MTMPDHENNLNTKVGITAKKCDILIVITATYFCPVLYRNNLKFTCLKSFYLNHAS